MKQDFSKRIAIVVNRDLEQWQVLNTTAHISANFGNLLGENFGTAPFFVTQNNAKIPRNTQYPIIILGANTEELQQFAISSQNFVDVEIIYFIREMIETTSDKKIAKLLKTKNFKDIEFLGVGLFGENNIVKSLTNRFNLF